MWNQRRSLLLSRICVLIFMVALAAVLVGGPWIVKWLAGYSRNFVLAQKGLFLTTLYSGGAVAAVLLICLYRLLNNIAKNQLFNDVNVSLLRRISWCCFIGGIIALLSGLYYLPWLVVAAAAGFMGLIVRIVKNLVAEAVVLKQENDFTI